jgi:hypothetical protein
MSDDSSGSGDRKAEDSSNSDTSGDDSSGGGEETVSTDAIPQFTGTEARLNAGKSKDGDGSEDGDSATGKSNDSES